MYISTEVKCDKNNNQYFPHLSDMIMNRNLEMSNIQIFVIKIYDRI